MKRSSIVVYIIILLSAASSQAVTALSCESLFSLSSNQSKSKIIRRGNVPARIDTENPVFAISHQEVNRSYVRDNGMIGHDSIPGLPYKYDLYEKNKIVRYKLRTDRIEVELEDGRIYRSSLGEDLGVFIEESGYPNLITAFSKKNKLVFSSIQSMAVRSLGHGLRAIVYTNSVIVRSTIFARHFNFESILSGKETIVAISTGKGERLLYILTSEGRIFGAIDSDFTGFVQVAPNTSSLSKTQIDGVELGIFRPSEPQIDFDWD